MEPVKARPRPCASCPYRRDVPSGVWHEDEYEKLKGYDAEMGHQPVAVFSCHQADGRLCSGWLGAHGPDNLLSVRIGLLTGRVDPSALDYTTATPLFASGAEAAEHGVRDIEHPTAAAAVVILKVTRVRSARGVPVVSETDEEGKND